MLRLGVRVLEFVFTHKRQDLKFRSCFFRCFGKTLTTSLYICEHLSLLLSLYVVSKDETETKMQADEKTFVKCCKKNRGVFLARKNCLSYDEG